MTLPATRSDAPAHHIGGRASEKMAKPVKAVTRKFVEVFMMETWVADLPRARAVVNRDHMMPLKVRLRMKKMERTMISTIWEWDCIPRALAMAVDMFVVSSVVVSFANTPLNAAQAPLATAKNIQCFLHDEDSGPSILAAAAAEDEEADLPVLELLL